MSDGIHEGVERLEQLQAESDAAGLIVDEMRAILDKHSGWIVMVAMCRLIGHGLAQAPRPDLQVSMAELMPHIVNQFEASCQQRQVLEQVEAAMGSTAVN